MNAALHKMHGGHAKPSLPFRRAKDHLSGIETVNSRPEDKTMNLIQNYRNWRRYRRTVDELSRLSNRELNDLGINRGDIVSVARRSL